MDAPAPRRSYCVGRARRESHHGLTGPETRIHGAHTEDVGWPLTLVVNGDRRRVGMVLLRKRSFGEKPPRRLRRRPQQTFTNPQQTLTKKSLKEPAHEVCVHRSRYTCACRHRARPQRCRLQQPEWTERVPDIAECSVLVQRRRVDFQRQVSGLVSSKAPATGCPAWGNSGDNSGTTFIGLMSPEEAAIASVAQITDAWYVQQGLDKEEFLANRIAYGIAQDKNGDGLLCVAQSWGENLNPNSHWALIWADTLSPPAAERWLVTDNRNGTPNNR